MPAPSPLAPVYKGGKSYLQPADNLRLVVCCPQCKKSYLLTLEEFRGLMVEYFSRMKVGQGRKAHLMREVFGFKPGYIRYMDAGSRKKRGPGKKKANKANID